MEMVFEQLLGPVYVVVVSALENCLSRVVQIMAKY